MAKRPLRAAAFTALCLFVGATAAYLFAYFRWQEPKRAAAPAHLWILPGMPQLLATPPAFAPSVKGPDGKPPQ